MLANHIARAQAGVLSDATKDEFEATGFTILRRAIPERAQSDFLSVVREMIAGRAAAVGLAERLGEPPEDLAEFFAAYVPALDREAHDIIKLVYDSCFATIAARGLLATPEIV